MPPHRSRRRHRKRPRRPRNDRHPLRTVHRNAAQGALGTLPGNDNAILKRAGEIGGASTAAHATLGSIQAASIVSGGVDEDQRQLNVLSDEASQTMIVSDRLKRDATQA